MENIPVYDLIFKIGTAGVASVTADFKEIKDIETFSVSIDGSTEEWNPMDAKGWIKRMLTGKSMTVSCSGKRNYTDAGNSYVAGMMLKTGNDCNSVMEITFPNADKLTIPGVVDLKTPFGGDSTAVDSLEFDLLSSGKPTYVEGV